MWQSQLNSATLSLVDDDIVNKILQSQIVQFFQIWQKLLEYLVIFVNDLRINDGIFITKYSEYNPSYYPSITVRDNYIIPMLYQPIVSHWARFSIIILHWIPLWTPLTIHGSSSTFLVVSQIQ